MPVLFESVRHPAGCEPALENTLRCCRRRHLEECAICRRRCTEEEEGSGGELPSDTEKQVDEGVSNYPLVDWDEIEQAVEGLSNQALVGWEQDFGLAASLC